MNFDIDLGGGYIDIESFYRYMCSLKMTVVVAKMMIQYS
jgi:hypothetical protein